jgi:hypothetical protein
MATSTKENMSNEITPTDSVCPIYLQPTDPAQVAADQAEAKALAKAQTARIAAREALLTKLGITADEAQLLLGA